MLGNFKKFALLVGDVVVLYGTLYLTLLIRYRELPTGNIWSEHLLPFSLLFLVWIIIFYVNGLYDIATAKNDVAFYNRILRNLIMNYAIAAGYFYLLSDKLFNIKPQTVFFIYIAVNSAVYSLWRFWYNTAVSRPGSQKNVLVIGMKDEARELVEEIANKPQLGYRIAAVVSSQNHVPQFDNVKIYNSSADLKKILREQNISTVVTAIDPRGDAQLVKHLFGTLSLRIQFFDLPDLYEKLTGKIPVTSIGHIWFLENIAKGEKSGYEFTKRALDILISTIGLGVSLPVWPLIALGVKLSSPGPSFFRQMRVGFLGRPFMVVKFRSMITDQNNQGKAQWASANDARITKFGRFMRKTRLDELPQLWNIIRGDMSLIGPRPEQIEFVRDLERDIPFYNERHLVKPGLTGWAQINFQYGESTGDAFKKLQYDLFYVKNRSIPLDLGIILRTINIIISGKGQ